MIPLDMSLVVTQSDERTWAVFTFEHSWAQFLGEVLVSNLGVPLYMGYEMVFLGETLTAQVTLKRFLTSMNSEMYIKCTHSEKSLVAYITIHTFAFVMEPHVHLHTVLPTESLVTNGTFKLLLNSMYH